MDQFYYPTGIAIHHEPPGCVAGTAGCQSQLLVVSSNFDLVYDVTQGGTLISVDVGKALADAAVPGAPSPLPLTPLGAVQIGSFGGELAIVDAETCPGWTGGAQALVASRSLVELYRVDIGSQGALSCGGACVVPLDSSIADPFDVTIACGLFPVAPGAPPSQQALAFVTYLRAVDAHGWLSEIDLAATDATGQPSSPMTSVNLQISPTGQSVFDPSTTRIYVTGRFSQSGYSPLRWFELATPGAEPASANLATVIRGADPRGIAISSDHTRAYVGMRLYDQDLAISYDSRPATDLGGALAVIDLAALTSGSPTLGIIDIVPLDVGVTEVRAIARPGKRDLVAVVATDNSTLTLYDDDAGAIAQVFGVCGALASGAGNLSAPAPCDDGAPMLGFQPFGLAVEPLADGTVRLYVGSFDRGWINVLQIDPMHPAAVPTSWIRIGPERTP